MPGQAPASAPHDTKSALAADVVSFGRHCRAGNLSPRTTETYMDAASRLAAFLADHGMPTELSEIRREHVESFIADQLDHFKATTAHNRYRGCQAFFRWALDEGLVKESPMARTKPPRLPEAPPAILRDPELRALLGVCETDKSFAGIRDAALVRIFLDTGARRAEISNLRYDPSDDMANDVDLDQGLIRVLGKGRRERIVPVGNKTIRALDRYLRVRRACVGRRRRAERRGGRPSGRPHRGRAHQASGATGPIRRTTCPGPPGAGCREPTFHQRGPLH